MSTLNFNRVTGACRETVSAIEKAHPGQTARFVRAGDAARLLQKGWSFAATADKQTVLMGQGKASEQILVLSPAPKPKDEPKPKKAEPAKKVELVKDKPKDKPKDEPTTQEA